MTRIFCFIVFFWSVQVGNAAVDPWTPRQTIQSEALAKDLASPEILMVGPRILYNGAHIIGAAYAGPAGTAEGLDILTKAVARIPKDRAVVIYCGCCPMDKCPNVRPAFQKLKELGYQSVKVLIIPTNLHDDWIAKGYPVEKGDIRR